MRDGLKNTRVAVAMPKFKMTREFELSKTLAAMGMPLAFSANADFSGMDGKTDLSISAVIHKAFVAVDEKGTEAAAATAVAIRTLSLRRPLEEPERFKADHPFIFLIRDARSGAILFLGRFTGPAA
jgi:serpin B